MGSIPSLYSNLQPSPFYEACALGNIDAVEKMIPHLTSEQINQVKPNGNTALHAACLANHVEIIRLLLPHSLRATVNRQ